MKEETVTIDGITYSADMATVLSADKGITTFQLIRGVRYIGECAFAGCKNLRVVHIPETVIRIEDCAFRDCPGLREVHFPYYIEYISPLAFTFSNGFDRFYYYNLKVTIPNDAFLKFTYMIPQFISELDYKKYGLALDDLEEVDGWSDLDGLPIFVNEDELYRMAIKDSLRYEYKMVDDKDQDRKTDEIPLIYKSVLHSIFDKKLCDFLFESELVQAGEGCIINMIEDSFHALIEHRINQWLKLSQNYRPIELIYDTLYEALQMGFVTSVLFDSNDTELYGENLFFYLLLTNGEAMTGFNHDEIENNRTLKEWYERMLIDTGKVVNCYFLKYNEYGYPINVGSLKHIVRQSMRMLFHIGYSYGVKYRTCIIEG